ncbi:MAG TPA: hypothetical protein HPP56_03955, partial [Nitrospirae bacterium]|nr:hypothetical protein [Nitrospirota bacterium]
MDAFNNMKDALNQIVQQLQVIEDQLNSLFTELEITKEEIIANTNDPTDAITQINTFHDNLNNMSNGKNPGECKQVDILDFANTVETNYQIENDVNQIHDAILPPTLAKTPVIENFTTLALNNINPKGKNPVDAYNGIERYFSQLMLYQLKGVNLVVETKNAKKKAGVSEPVDASTYWNAFMTKKYQPQVDN